MNVYLISRKAPADWVTKHVASGNVRVILVSLCEVADDPSGLTEVKIYGRRTRVCLVCNIRQPKD